MAGWEDIRHRPAVVALKDFKRTREKLFAFADLSALTCPSFHLLIAQKTPILRAHV